MIQQQIQQALTSAITALQENGTWPSFALPSVTVERPKDLSHGDWTSNIAMVLAKQVKKAPLAVAEDINSILTVLGVQELLGIAQVDIVAPGYINVTLERRVFVDTIAAILAAGDAYGTNETQKGQTVMVEYTQPNPFKPFHIGHLMSNAIGESLARLVAATGATVIRANYQGDVGLHIAKAIWGLMAKGWDASDIAKIGEAYAYGHTMYEDDAAAKAEIVQINKAVYAQDDDAVNALYTQGREVTLAHFEELYAILGTTFDHYFFESQTWQIGQKLVEEHMDTVFERSDGAVIFDGEKHGLHKRVFITAEGVPTYEAKELGLAFLKRQATPADRYIVTTAVEQQRYFEVVITAIETVDPDFAGKITNITHGMMTLPDGKMSSRKGNVVTGEDLIQQAQALAAEKLSERVGTDAAQETIDAVAVAGLKFSILRQSLGKNVVYDADAALSFDGDSGPYIQYTAVRCFSVLQKARDLGLEPDASSVPDETTVLLERLLAQFPDVVATAASAATPHILCTYALDLAHAFNAYYAKHQIADTEISTAPYRLAVVQAVSQVITTSLYLLGIKTPRRM